MNKLLVFSAAWCTPCKNMKPAVELLKLQNPSNVFQYDISDESTIRHEYGIQAVPTIVVLDSEDKEIQRVVGAKNYDNLKMLLGV